MSLSLRRTEMKGWYGFLLAVWLTFTLPIALIVLLWSSSPPGGPSLAETLVRAPLNSLLLLKGDPPEVVLFFWIWLPLLTAPFGVRKIPQE